MISDPNNFLLLYEFSKNKSYNQSYWSASSKFIPDPILNRPGPKFIPDPELNNEKIKFVIDTRYHKPKDSN